MLIARHDCRCLSSRTALGLLLLLTFAGCGSEPDHRLAGEGAPTPYATQSDAPTPYATQSDAPAPGEGAVDGPSCASRLQGIEHFGFYASSPASGDYTSEVQDHSDFVFIWADDLAGYEQRLQSARQAGLKAVVDVKIAFFTGGESLVLFPDYRERWQRMADLLEPYRDVLLAIYPLDEPWWNAAQRGRTHDAMSEDLQRVGETIKERFPEIPLQVTLAYPTLRDGGLVLPAAFDWFGFDRYDCFDDCGQGESIPAHLASLKQRIVSLNGADGGCRRLVLLPQAAISSVSEVRADDLIRWAQQYMSLAQDEPLVVGVMPFIWPSFVEAGSVGWIGARDLPTVRHTFRKLGASITKKPVTPAPGPFRIDGDPASIYYSNGATAYCGYSSWAQFQSCTGRTSAEGILSFPQPTQLQYHGPCAPCL